MTIRKATITGKNQHGAHAPLFRASPPPPNGDSFRLTPAKHSSCRTRAVRPEAGPSGRAYVAKLNKNGTFWVADSRSDGQGGYLVWLSWNQAEAKRRREVQRRKPQK